MDKKELERRLEAAEKQNIGLMDEIKNLKAQLAEMQDEPEIPDFPEFNFKDVTYTLDSCLDVLQEEHGGGTGDGDYTGDDALLYNNFHNAYYAHEFRKKCLLIAMMLHCKWYLDRGFVQDWDNCDDKYTVWYNHADNEWTIDVQEIHEMPSIYFSTQEAAQKCADWLNKHWRKNDEESV